MNHIHLRAWIKKSKVHFIYETAETKAVITEDEEIDIHIFAGGIELLVPKNVNIEVKSHSFIGSVSDNTDKRTIPGAPCLHVVASNFFGGVNIKYE
jgi:predicted membrane protein